MSPPSMRGAIRASGLTRRFGAFTAVDDVSIEVARGAIFAFVGANGSGKSTTIRMLIGLLRPSAGAVEVDGIDVIRHPRRVRDHIGYMGQRVSLYAGLTLRENVEFYAGLYGIARRWRRAPRPRRRRPRRDTRPRSGAAARPAARRRGCGPRR